MSEFLMLLQENLEFLITNNNAAARKEVVDEMARACQDIVDERKKLVSSIDNAEDNRILPSGVNKPRRQFIEESYRELRKCDNMIIDAGYEKIIRNNLYLPDREVPSKDQAITIIREARNDQSSNS